MDGSPIANDEIQIGAEAAWFEVDPTPRLVLDSTLEIVRMNASARALLARQAPDGWRVEARRLRAPSPDQDHLAAFVSASGAQACRTTIIAGVLLRTRPLGAPGSDLFGVELRDLRSAVAITSADLEPVYGITRAEQQTLVLLLRGYSANEVANILNKSVLTVRTHVKHMHAKLNVRTKGQLFARVTPFLFID